METKFKEIKAEILRRAKAASACKEQYRRAALAEDMDQLCTVIKDNFRWACEKKVLSADLLKQYEATFFEHEIYVNISVERGFLLCDNATVRAFGSATVMASGNATVEAFGNATVEAFGNATVTASDNATVEAFGSATVEAFGSATVEASGNATVTASDNATVRAFGNATVRAFGSATVEAFGSATVEAFGNATVEASGNATVRATGSAYCSSYEVLECKLSDNALYRVRSTNTIYYANDNLKFQKQ